MSHKPETADVIRPDFDQLRHHGWHVGAVVGKYVVAWRGHEEIVFTWQGNGWKVVPAQPKLRAA